MLRNIFKLKVTKNSIWIIGEQTLQMICGFFLTIFVSRYLGPENYGILSYGATLVSFFGIIAKLGIDSIIVNELIRNRNKEGNIIGASIVLRVASSIISILLLSILVFVLKLEEKEVIITSIVQSIAILFQSANIFDSWFQSKLKSKYSAIAKALAYFSVALFKIILLLFKKNIYWFAASTTLDSLLILITSLIIYKKQKGQKLHFDKQIAKQILRKSYHFIVSGILVYIYTQTDKIMIGQILDNKELGYYSAALNICSMWINFPLAILTSLRVVVFEAKEKSEKYLKKLKQTYAILFYSSTTICFLITILSGIIINILYGAQYSPAETNLKILTWYVPFSILGAARGIWIVSENKNKYVKKYAFIGVILNIILNLVLIPKIGINGAAIATVITEICTCFIAPLFFKETRKHTKILLEALLLRFNQEINSRLLYHKIIGKISPKTLSKILYKEKFNKKLNLKNPQSFNEKLMWLKIYNYNKNPLVWKCSDKYEVRNYIKSKGISEENLPKIITIYNNADEIDFDKLPDKFALKCSHGSGFNIICTDKNKLNYEEVKKQLNKWLNTNFGLTTAEPHYSHIKPKIICEKFIKSSEYDWPIDYKIYCFNGMPKFIIVHTDRKNTQKIISYDTNWNKIKTRSNEDKSLEIKKPNSLDKMLEMSHILSKDFPFVRIDYYEEDKTPIIGEMTFTPAACLAPWTNKASQEYGKILIIKKEGDEL